MTVLSYCASMIAFLRTKQVIVRADLIYGGFPFSIRVRTPTDITFVRFDVCDVPRTFPTSRVDKRAWDNIRIHDYGSFLAIEDVQREGAGAAPMTAPLCKP